MISREIHSMCSSPPSLKLWNKPFEPIIQIYQVLWTNIILILIPIISIQIIIVLLFCLDYIILTILFWFLNHNTSLQVEQENCLVLIPEPLTRHWANPVEMDPFSPELEILRSLLLIVLFVSLVLTLSFPYVIMVLLISRGV